MTPEQARALIELRKRHHIVRTYQERSAPCRLFAYTGEYNGVEISIYDDGLILGEPDDEPEHYNTFWS